MLARAPFAAVSDPNDTSIFPLPPATRSALIIGGSFFIFILLAMFGVLHKAQGIKQQQELTKALNSQSSSGEMVWIPEGKMTMGANDGAPDEHKLHDVKVRGFWMDKTEVTNEQFARFVKETGYITVAERKPEIAGRRNGAARTARTGRVGLHAAEDAGGRGRDLALCARRELAAPAGAGVEQRHSHRPSTPAPRRFSRALQEDERSA